MWLGAMNARHVRLREQPEQVNARFVRVESRFVLVKLPFDPVNECHVQVRERLDLVKLRFVLPKLPFDPVNVRHV